MFLNILIIYAVGLVVIGLPLLFACCAEILDLTDEMACAIVIFYPIVVIILLIRGVIKTIKGLLDFIKLLFKGDIF